MADITEHKPAKEKGRLATAWESDVMWSFRHSPVAVLSLLVVLILVSLMEHLQ